MTSLRLLDAFCGAGGCSVGYSRAGFDVVGVDINPQPNYPFEFRQGDALEFIAAHGHEFDVIHASPPCQAYSVLKHLTTKDSPELVEEVRDLLFATGKPFVIENVPGAPLDNPLVLCGSMFGLPLIRHRLFECRPALWFPPGPCQCKHLYTHAGNGVSSFGNGATAISVAGHNYRADDGRLAMGIDWMTRSELSQAIPPAYTEYIGRQLLKALEAVTE